MSHDTDLAWLAGFLDGEGSLVLYYSGGQHKFISTILQTVSTNEDNIRRVKAIISEIVGREIRYRLGKGKSLEGRRPTWYLQVTRQEDIAAVCVAILPYLVGKKPQAELMLRYLASSPKATHTRGSRMNPVSGYTEAHHQMVSEMRHLNRRYAFGEWLPQQETKLTAPEPPGEVIVRTP